MFKKLVHFYSSLLDCQNWHTNWLTKITEIKLLVLKYLNNTNEWYVIDEKS